MSRSVPQQLVEYLTTLISPPDFPAMYIEDLTQLNWTDVATWADNSVAGILAGGQPSEEQSKELLRVLKPGAHLLLIAPDEEPTGHTGACRIEDAGFEIRDAILWIDTPEGFHYVAKAARNEREEGCCDLEGKTGAEATDREEDTAGLDSPRAGAGRTAPKIKNFHPCLHPDALVMTTLGYRPISEIEMGTEVYAADGRFHVVEDVSHHPYTSPALFEITIGGTGNCATVASDNHPFLILRDAVVGWLPACEIKAGDFTLTPLLNDPTVTKIAAGIADFWSHFFQVSVGASDPSKPVQEYEGVFYIPKYVKSVTPVPYTGEVWNLTVEGSPTFQTAVGMSHNTVKPVELMARLMNDIPKDQGPVLDCFMGSGSTGVACIQTGHDFIGIEREAEYLEIADTRIRHANEVGSRNKGRYFERAELVSDFTPPPPPKRRGLDFINGDDEDE